MALTGATPAAIRNAALPLTGTDAIGIALVAAAVLITGGLLLYATRRRTATARCHHLWT